VVNILLLDANTVYHTGNAALIESTIEQLKTQFSETKITILAFDPDSIAKMFPEHKTLECLWATPVSSYSRTEKIKWAVCESMWTLVNTLNYSLLAKMRVLINPQKYTFSSSKIAALKAFSDADIIVSISGEMLSSHNWKRLPLFLYGYWLSHAMGKIVAIYPQSIGPFDKKLTKLIVRYVLRKCDVIFPRDRISLANINKLRIPESKVHLVPDVAVNQPCISSNEAKNLFNKEGVDFSKRPLVGITLSKFKESDYQSYFFAIKKLCDFIVHDIKGMVVLISPNMPYKQEVSDFSLAQGLYKNISCKNNVRLLSNLYSPSELKGMLGELDLFISTRMHASILSTMRGTPTITINTQPKLKGYMEMISQEAWSCEIEDFTIEKAKQMVREILANSEQVRESLVKAKCEVGSKALMATTVLKDIYIRKHKGSDLDNR
jgi:polysaccharide pyruvyl transferase WcaK-like protein